MLTDLPAARERAQRLLDGMTVNRDALARDIQALAAECEMWRTRHVERDQAGHQSFAEAFNDALNSR